MGGSTTPTKMMKVIFCLHEIHGEIELATPSRVKISQVGEIFNELGIWGSPFPCEGLAHEIMNHRFSLIIP